MKFSQGWIGLKNAHWPSSGLPQEESSLNSGWTSPFYLCPWSPSSPHLALHAHDEESISGPSETSGNGRKSIGRVQFEHTSAHPTNLNRVNHLFIPPWLTESFQWHLVRFLHDHNTRSWFFSILFLVAYAFALVQSENDLVLDLNLLPDNTQKETDQLTSLEGNLGWHERRGLP